MESTATDWIQAIGVLLGVPVGIWSIISLFRKDKEKEEQLNSLNSIALSQNQIIIKLSEQIEQLTIQSSEFQYQSSLMKDANLLLEKQIALQYDFYIHGKETESKKLELERNKRLSEIKPYFISRTYLYSPDMFDIKLENKGGEARKLKIAKVDTKLVRLKSLPENLKIGKLENFSISGQPNPQITYLNGKSVTFEINLEFEDIDGNTYIQNIKRLQTGRCIIEEPILK